MTELLVVFCVLVYIVSVIAVPLAAESKGYSASWFALVPVLNTMQALFYLLATAPVPRRRLITPEEQRKGIRVISPEEQRRRIRTLPPDK